MEILNDEIVQVGWGENERGQTYLHLYVAQGGMVEIIAAGVRDKKQPFEHGATMTAEFWPSAVPETLDEEETE